MELGSGSEQEQIETAHIFVNDFMDRIAKSDVEFNPQIIAAVLIKKAGEILKEHHKDSQSDFVDSVNDNFKQLYLLQGK